MSAAHMNAFHLNTSGISAQAALWALAQGCKLAQRIALIAGGLGGISVGVLAQTPVCNQIRIELTALPNAGGGGGGEAGRLRTELSRIRLALQQNDCNARGFLFFGGQAPVCAPLRAQAGQYEARLSQLQGGGGSGPNAQRRAQLVAALERYNCLGPQQGGPAQRGVIYANPQAPSLFDQLFGNRPGARVDEAPLLERNPELDAELEQKAKLGGRMAICVRTCDGYFFPVNFEGISARDEHAAVCQALCPYAETQVFFMRLGGDVSLAATRSGQPYTALPNALRYREKRDEACFCKPPGVTWAKASEGVEDIVEARKGDMIITREQAEAMSRPKADQPAQKGRDTRNQKQAAALPRQELEPTSIPDNTLPTGGNASSGIGPKLRADPVVSSGQGKTQETIGADGVRRQVRVVAPGLAVQDSPPSLRGAARP